MDDDPKIKCAFCKIEPTIKESHIVSKFVFDWLKETAATDYIRYSHTPNKPEQDGLKVPLLCKKCEQTFGVWEKQVAKNIFKPLYDNPSNRYEYQKWLAKFSASICWRVLTFFKTKNGFDRFSDKLKDSKDKALQRWEDFLKGKESNPGPYELHILPLDGLADSADPDTPPNMSRYFLRTVDIDAACTNNSAFIYAKMCHLLLVGFIEMPSAKHWHGTKVHINRGYIGGKVDYCVPANFQEYLKHRARLVAKAQDLISEKQQDRITRMYQKDLDRAANSESIRAMNFDVALFGRAAFNNDENEQ